MYISCSNHDYMGNHWENRGTPPPSRTSSGPIGPGGIACKNGRTRSTKGGQVTSLKHVEIMQRFFRIDWFWMKHQPFWWGKSMISSFLEAWIPWMAPNLSSARKAFSRSAGDFIPDLDELVPDEGQAAHFLWRMVDFFAMFWCWIGQNTFPQASSWTLNSRACLMGIDCCLAGNTSAQCVMCTQGTKREFMNKNWGSFFGYPLWTCSRR